MKFEIEVRNIPRNAKLCFVVYEIAKNAKGARSKKLKESTNKVSFVSMGKRAKIDCFLPGAVL